MNFKQIHNWLHDKKGNCFQINLNANTGDRLLKSVFIVWRF